MYVCSQDCWRGHGGHAKGGFLQTWAAHTGVCEKICLLSYVCILYDMLCVYVTYSFWVSPCLVILGQKLLSSLWFGAPEAYDPNNCLFRRSFCSQTPVWRSRAWKRSSSLRRKHYLTSSALHRDLLKQRRPWPSFWGELRGSQGRGFEHRSTSGIEHVKNWE